MVIESASIWLSNAVGAECILDRSIGGECAREQAERVVQTFGSLSSDAIDAVISQV